MFLLSVNEIACRLVTHASDSQANFRRVMLASNVLYSWHNLLRPGKFNGGDRSQAIVQNEGISIYVFINLIPRRDSVEVVANVQYILTDNTCR